MDSYLFRVSLVRPGRERGCVLFVQSFEFIPPYVGETGSFVGTEQRPRSVLAHPPHEEVRHPQRSEEVSCPEFFLAVVFANLQKGEDVTMPRFEVHGDRRWTLVAAVVDHASDVIEHAQQWEESFGGPASAGYVRVFTSDIVEIQSDPASVLGNFGALANGLEDGVEAVRRVLEETRR